MDGARSVRIVQVVLAFAGALLLAACQTGGGNSPTARADIGGGSSARAIAFESIDGPPQPVFQRLVSSLGSEADSRNLRVVSREQDAGYRVRGYLAASVEDNKGTVDWVWDVFDADRVRVLRVSGSEQVGDGTDVWARCDDQVLERIAAASLTEIASRLDTPPTGPAKRLKQPAAPGPAPAVPTGDGPPVASTVPEAQPAGVLALAPGQ